MSKTEVVPAVTKSCISVPCFVFEKIPQVSAAWNRPETICFVSSFACGSCWIIFWISFIVNSSEISLRAEMVFSMRIPGSDVRGKLKTESQSSAANSLGFKAKVLSKGMFFSLYSSDFPAGMKTFTGRDFVFRSHDSRRGMSFSFLYFIVQKMPIVSKINDAMFCDSSEGRSERDSAITPKV